MIAIIPDVHGRRFWTAIKDRVDDFDKIIFLGDYLDPYYPNEKILPEDAIANFEEIIEFAKQYPDKVILLIGNHDCWSIDRRKESCRHAYVFWQIQHDMFMNNKDLFKYAHIEGNVLYTHAGVTKEWIEQNNFDLNESNIVEFLNSDPKELWQVGMSRGGWCDHSSPIWACAYGDWPMSHNPFNLIQIFGHSQQMSTGSKVSFCNNTCHCIDSRAIFTWDNNELKVF